MWHQVMKAKPFSGIIMCISSLERIRLWIQALLLCGSQVNKYDNPTSWVQPVETHPWRADIFVSLFALCVWLISIPAGRRICFNLLSRFLSRLALVFHGPVDLHPWQAFRSRLVVVHRPELDLCRAAVLLKTVQVPDVQDKEWIMLHFNTNRSFMLKKQCRIFWKQCLRTESVMHYNTLPPFTFQGLEHRHKQQKSKKHGQKMLPPHSSFLPWITAELPSLWCLGDLFKRYVNIYMMKSTIKSFKGSNFAYYISYLCQ